MARAYAGIGQETLAAKLEISRGTLWKMEHGKRRATRGELWQVSECCGVPMWILENPWHEFSQRLPERRHSENNDGDGNDKAPRIGRERG